MSSLSKKNIIKMLENLCEMTCEICYRETCVYAIGCENLFPKGWFAGIKILL